MNSLTARDALSNRVVVAHRYCRPGDILRSAYQVNATHCVVVDQSEQQFVGLLRFCDALESPYRLFADLVPNKSEKVFGPETSLSEIAEYINRSAVGAVAIDRLDGPPGVVTKESLLEAELMAARKALQEIRSKNSQLEAQLGSMRDEVTRLQPLESVSLIAGGIAHDCNNLLTLVFFNSELVLAPPQQPDEITRQAVEEIEMAAQQISGLTTQLLEFVRRKPTAVTKIFANEVLLKMERILKRITGPGIDLCLAVPDSIPPLVADRSMIEQILLNLVVNARDAITGNGRIEISLKSVSVPKERVRDDLTHICITVSDTGSGMDPITAKHIFEPFFTTKAGKGTGLGLSIVHTIVTRYNGWIDVESIRGTGTKFHVYLPALDSNHSN